MLIRTLTPGRRAPAQPACEKCHYPVAGLASFVCPECGEDLRRSGIITVAMEIRRRGSLGAALLAWFLICGLVTWLIAGRLAAPLLFYSAGPSRGSRVTNS